MAQEAESGVSHLRLVETKSWRISLRAYLAASLKGEASVTVGELVDRFADAIPLHAAARKWAANGSRHNEELPPAYKMRFYTLTQELHWLGCTFEPIGYRVRKTYDTRVIPHGRVCADCGEVYVSETRRPTHGVLCPARRHQ